jgi:endonuclease/exonuclease/phosphatase family metal-dependent hydrolase
MTGRTGLGFRGAFKNSFLLAALLAAHMGLAQRVLADEFRILAWNVESNRPGAPQVSDPGVISEQLAGLLRAPATRAQIVALSEVDPKTMPIYKQAVAEGLGSEVDFVTSASGGYRDSDSLVLVVDAKRFAIEDVFELHRYAGISANFNVMDEKSMDYGAVRARSPLVAKLRDKEAGRVFWLIVNHLARGESDLRVEQAKALRKWAEDHASEPIIAAGDFNFDYDFRTQKGNPAYDAMMAGGVWQWLKPDPLIDSNWADDRDNPGRDRYPDSILDFVFVANSAKNWRGESDVVVRQGDFPDSDKTSDHRPIIATFEP